jgi:predicted ATPase/class 3 adenylate cyclase
MCGFCGTPLVAPVAAEVRKTVTVVFCDLKGSTDLGERLDPEAVREVLNRYFSEMRAVVERHGGLVEKYIGDAIMAVFGLPRLHEDDALRAVRAAWEMQRTLERINRDLESGWGVTLANRIGVNTGEVVAGDPTSGQRLVSGDTVNVAARLEQAAPEMGILIGASTLRLVRSAVEVEHVEPLALKGKSELVAAFRLLAARGREGVTRRLDLPVVGRDAEMTEILAAFERVSAHRHCGLVTLCGHAGMGKTRLSEEFLHQVVGPATVLRGRCLPYGEGITFWPLAEMLTDAAGIREDDERDVARSKLAGLVGGDAGIAARLAGAIGLSDDVFSLQETFWAVRKLLEVLSVAQPVVILFDDIHWAEATFLDLIEHVVDMTEGRVLVLCGTRHELFEERPTWMEGRENAIRIVLQALSEADGVSIIDHILGDMSLPSEVQQRIFDGCEGNPLFVEQMVSMLIDDGLLSDASGHWQQTGDLTSVMVPPTISALLSARLDRLSDGERAVLQTGSVAGLVFPVEAVQELAPAAIREHVGREMETLVRKLLIRADAAIFASSSVFRFEHLMVRDCAYQGLLKRTRAELHERYGEWVERVAGDRIAEYEEIVGYHLEQAHALRAELGPVDARGVAIGVRAAAWLASSGHRALSRGDTPAAAKLLQRARGLLSDHPQERLELAADLADALQDLGKTDTAQEVLGEAIEIAVELNDGRREAHLRLAAQLLSFVTGAENWAEAADAQARTSIEVFEAAGDHAGLARAWRLLATVHGTACRYGPAEAALLHALDHAHLAGDSRQVAQNCASLALCALLGPLPVAEGIRRCDELLEQITGDRQSAALVMAYASELHAMNGEVAVSRELIAQSRSILEDLGGRMHATLTALYIGRVELLADDPVRAEQYLRPDLEAFQEMGGVYYLSTVAALLSEALYLQGRLTEAEELITVCEQSADEGDPDTQHHWRSVRAKIAVRLGRGEEAERLAEEAVMFARRTDSSVFIGRALLYRAEVLDILGKRHDAHLAAENALAVAEAKGDVVSAARATALRDGPAEVLPDQVLVIQSTVEPRTAAG